jgi:SWIM zinc finger
MQSSLHGMIDKAKRYAEEPYRLQFEELSATVRGDNSDHVVRLASGRLTCDCDHFQHERLCAHVLTVERVLKEHLPANAAPYPGSGV